MYVWKISLNQKWTNDKSWDDAEVEDYLIANKSAEVAIEKAKKLALSESFYDDEAGQTDRVTAVRLWGVELDSKIDG